MIQVLADNSFGDTRSGGLAGPTGLVIILLLAIGTVFLIRNMNSRLRNLPDRFPPPPRRTPAAPVSAVPDPGARPAATEPGAVPGESAGSSGGEETK